MPSTSEHVGLLNEPLDLDADIIDYLKSVDLVSGYFYKAFSCLFLSGCLSSRFFCFTKGETYTTGRS